MEENNNPIETKKNKAPLYIGIILIVILVIFAGLAIYSGNIFVKKEDKKDNNTTSTTTTSTTTVEVTTTTTKAINITLTPNKAKKDYEKDDEIKPEEEYSNEDYSIIYDEEDDLYKLKVNNKIIDNTAGVAIEKVHRYKYFLIVESRWHDSDPWITLVDYDGNVLYVSNPDETDLNDQGEFVYGEDVDDYTLDFTSYYYDPTSYTLTIKYYKDYDGMQKYYESAKEEYEDENELNDIIDTYKDYCTHLKNTDSYGEVFTTITLDGNKFTKEKFNNGTKAKTMKEAIDFCKKSVNVDIK